MTKVLYKVKKKKTLPLFIGLIMATSVTVIIRLFASEKILPDWSVYCIPLVWTFCLFLTYALTRGTIEVTINSVSIKVGNEIIEQMQIKDVKSIDRIVVDESVLAGSASRTSVGRYLVLTDGRGKKLKINRTAYSEKQLEEAVQYIEYYQE